MHKRRVVNVMTKYQSDVWCKMDYGSYIFVIIYVFDVYDVGKRRKK